MRTTRRTFVSLVAAGVVSGCLGDGMSVSSSFGDDEEIPVEHTCDGEEVSPPLDITEVPEEAETLAVIVDDPDAPGGTFVHWLLWNVPADVGNIPGGVASEPTVGGLGGARQGTNDADKIGYAGPCPPEGDGQHTYRFFVHAVDRELDVEGGATREELESALDGSTVATGRLEGTYER